MRILRSPERLKVFPSVGHHLSCHPLFSPPVPIMPVKALLSPSPSPLSGTGQQSQKLQQRKGKIRQAELYTHACTCAERQHDHTPYFFRKSD